jgi:hypothetical protein
VPCFCHLQMTLLLTGFQRPEKRFASFGELKAGILQDVEDARVALDESVYMSDKVSALLLGGKMAVPETFRRIPFDSLM